MADTTRKSSEVEKPWELPGAELLTGIPGSKIDDLDDEYLEAVARGEQPLLKVTH